MKFIIVADKGSESFVRGMTRALDSTHSTYVVCRNGEQKAIEGGVDMALVAGDDKNFLRFLRSPFSLGLPTLFMGETDVKGGFLSETSVSDFGEVLPNILKGEYKVEEHERLKVTVDGVPQPPTLNEVAVFPSRSATLLEYRLNVDDEMVWRDYSDGVIISTPTGSTAYAMSAGGPMILRNANVCAVVSVNSMDITRRPLIVPGSSTITVSEIASASRCEAIIDGTFRNKVVEEIVVSQHPERALFVRLRKKHQTADMMSKKIHFAEELLQTMPASAKLIMATLRYEGPLTQQDLLRKTMLPGRTTRLAVNLLIERGLVKRRSLPRDARQKFYELANSD